MKILQVIPYFVPAYSYGGPVKVCFDISRELVRRGHQVTVVTTDALDDKNRVKKPQETIDGIKVIRFKNLSNSLAKNYNGYLPIGFRKWIKRNLKKYDIVHCHDFFTYLNLITTKHCIKNNIPYVNHPQGILLEKNQTNRFYPIKKIFTKIFSKSLSKSKKVICLTEIEKEELTKKYNLKEDQLEIIPNGLNINNYKTNTDKNYIINKYNLSKDCFVLGFIGRVQNIKGLDISLEILSLFKKEFPNFYFLIVGPNEGEKDKLIHQAKSLKIENNIIFTGQLRGKDKIMTMNCCDIFLFTSRSDGMPITSLEAAALKKPQLISEACNIHREIKKNNAGLTFDIQDKKKGCLMIKKILKNKKLANRLGENGRKMAQEKFSLERVFDDIEKIYKE